MSEKRKNNCQNPYNVCYDNYLNTNACTECTGLISTPVSSSLGRTSGSCKTIICKQKENRKDSWYLRIYRSDCNPEFSGIYNSRTCNYAWL